MTCLPFVCVVFLSMGYAAAQDPGAIVYETEGECLKEHTSVTRDYLENIKRTKFLPLDVTKDFKCFLACVGKKLEVMSHKGDLHFDPLKELTVEITGGHATIDDAHAMVSNCIEVGSQDDQCEVAYKYVQCKIVELVPFNFAKGFCPTCTPA